VAFRANPDRARHRAAAIDLPYNIMPLCASASARSHTCARPRSVLDSLPRSLECALTSSVEEIFFAATIAARRVEVNKMSSGIGALAAASARRCHANAELAMPATPLAQTRVAIGEPVTNLFSCIPAPANCNEPRRDRHAWSLRLTLAAYAIRRICSRDSSPRRA
jgi:hypothetical protein